MGLLIGLGSSGCFGAVAYPCSDDAQCRLDERVGACEPEGYCSLPDDDCASGRRFSEHAPSDLAGGCVDAAGGGTDSDGTAPVCEECGCAAQLVVALDRSCVIDHDGRLWCWGANEQGELGVPTDVGDAMAPRQVSLPGEVLEVALDGHACARSSEGVWCWGPDQQGQVSIAGAQSMADTVVSPTMPDDLRLAGAEAVAVGERWSCAIVGTGQQLLCWGELVHVEGTGRTWVAELGGPVVELRMTRRSVCARMEDGQVRCAGSNAAGELGVSPATLLSSREAVAIPGVSQTTGLAATVDLYCAHSAADAWCWGLNHDGEVGVAGSGSPQTTVPTRIELVPESLGLGMRTSCAVVSGVPWCWGRALPGISAASSPTPVAQDWLTAIVDDAIVEVGLGTEHACVRTERDEVWCWGSNERGQVGIPGSDGASPARVELPCDG